MIYGQFASKKTNSAGISGWLGTPHVKDTIARDKIRGVVATWLGASTHGVVIVLVPGIAIAVEDRDGGNEARIYLLVNVLN